VRNLKRRFPSLLRNQRVEGAIFLGGLVLVSVLMTWSYRLTSFSLRQPIDFSGDSLLTMSAINNMIHHSWYFTTPNLGYPFGQTLQDFPAVADGIFLTVMRLLTLVVKNPAAIFNGLFIAAFPLNYIGAYVGLRMVRVRPIIATGGAIVYALLPFNFAHGPGHVALVWNWSIPIWLSYILLRTKQESPTPHGTRISFRPDARNPTVDSTRRTMVAPILVGFIASCSGFYYFVFFLLVAIPCGLREAYVVRRLQKCQILKAVGFGLLTFGVQISPVLFFQHRFGSNLDVARRSLGEVAFYGLKPLGLMMSPSYSPFHGFLPGFSEVELNAENAVSIGFLLGLFTLAASIFFAFSLKRRHFESQLITFFLLVSMPFAGGYFLGALGFTQVRVWSRSAVVLGFLGIGLICALFEKFLLASSTSMRRKSLIYGFSAIFLTVQVVDSVPRAAVNTHSQISASWNELRTFTNSLIRSYGTGATIFQLPIIPFPENPPVGQMTDYEHLKPYLVQPKMFFSYGGVKGRSVPWADRLSPDPRRQIEEIAVIGFDALWIDRFGWQGENLYEMVLSEDFGLSPLVDRTKRYAVYDLRGIQTTLSTREKARILSPVVFRFGDGFGPEETDGATTWRWAGRAGRIVLTNLARSTVSIRLSVNIELRQEASLLLPNQCKISASEQSLVRIVNCRLRVSPAGATLKVATTAPLYVDDDPRDLRFRVTKIEIEQLQ
jgi:phosphoglycerol transferase